MLRKALLGSVIGLTAFAAAVEAANAPKGGLYEGPAKGSESRSDHRIVQIRVSRSGTKLDFRGPHERCGTFNPLKAYFPRIDDVKIKRNGRFNGDRKYTDTSRGPNYVLRWTVELSGRFTSNTKAKGTVKYEMSHQGRSPTEQFCGERNVTFTAKHTG
jgi:hypothetical protein